MKSVFHTCTIILEVCMKKTKPREIIPLLWHFFMTRELWTSNLKILQKTKTRTSFFSYTRYFVKNHHHHRNFLLACTHWLPSCFFPFLFLENNSPTPENANQWECKSMREGLLPPLTRCLDSWEEPFNVINCKEKLQRSERLVVGPQVCVHT